MQEYNNYFFTNNFSRDVIPKNTNKIFILQRCNISVRFILEICDKFGTFNLYNEMIEMGWTKCD